MSVDTASPDLGTNFQGFSSKRWHHSTPSMWYSKSFCVFAHWNLIVTAGKLLYLTDEETESQVWCLSLQSIYAEAECVCHFEDLAPVACVGLLELSIWLFGYWILPCWSSCPGVSGRDLLPCVLSVDDLSSRKKKPILSDLPQKKPPSFSSRSKAIQNPWIFPAKGHKDLT